MRWALPTLIPFGPRVACVGTLLMLMVSLLAVFWGKSPARTGRVDSLSIMFDGEFGALGLCICRRAKSIRLLAAVVAHCQQSL